MNRENDTFSKLSENNTGNNLQTNNEQFNVEELRDIYD